MRVRHINFAIAIAVSLALHLLLWPASMRVKVGGWDFGRSEPKRPESRSRSSLNGDSAPPPPVITPNAKPVPKPPEIQSEDEMGEATGKGTGAQAAKGERPLRAPEADQDQALLSRDPPGAGRIGDPPTEYTGPRGEEGSGGQVGGIQTPANPAHSASADLPKTDSPNNQNTSKSGAEMSPRTPRQSIVRGPEPPTPSLTPPNVAPPPSEKSAIGAATADVAKTPEDAVHHQGPLVQVASANESTLIVAPELGTPAEPKPAVSSAPPIPGASVEKAAIVKAPSLPLASAAVATPPPPAVDVALPKTANPTERPAQPTVATTADPNLIKTGDARGIPAAIATPPTRPRRAIPNRIPFSKTAVADGIARWPPPEVRKGRKIKTVRPHFLPSAEAAFFANPDARLVMKIAIDATGKVTSADIIRSAGSVEIDQPCRVAVYDWWIEPAHDKAGHAVPDVIEFTFFFR